MRKPADDPRSTPLNFNSPTLVLPAPPSDLGANGSDLWRRVTREFHFDDIGSLTLLGLACRAMDRAESLRKQIDNDGEVISGPNGPREHPLLKAEIANLSFLS